MSELIGSTSGAMASLLSRSCFLNLASYLALVYGLAGQEPATLPAILLSILRGVVAVPGVAWGWAGALRARLY